MWPHFSKPRYVGRSFSRVPRLEALEDRRLLSFAPVFLGDLNPAGDSNPQEFMANNGTAFFTATDALPNQAGVHGQELWKSDGTAAGTVLVKDIFPGPDGSSPVFRTVLDGVLLFDAVSPAGSGLWRSDGTAAGTQPVSTTDLPSTGGTYLYVSHAVPGGDALWKTDGTGAGTVLVKPIGPGRTNPFQVYPTSDEALTVGSTLYFVANDVAHGLELWKSDGTTAGTVLVKDINPGSGDEQGPTSLTAVNGTLFFSADDGVHGRELWKSDGSEAGTVLVKDINVSSLPDSDPSELTAVNGTLFFQAKDGHDSTRPATTDLWKSDGTEAGTVLVKRFDYGAFFGVSHLTDLNGSLVFWVDEDTRGTELWRSDGTTAGTVMIKDIYPGQFLFNGVFPEGNSSGPSPLLNVNDTLYFAASDGPHGTELWKSDGSEAGTVLVADINPGPAGSSPDNLAYAGGKLFFSADDGVHGREPWALQVAPLATNVSVTASPAVSVFGQPVGLTATVSVLGAVAETPRGTITFQVGSAVLGAAELDGGGHATLVVGSLGAGSHTITAAYAGNSDFAASTSGTVSLVVLAPPPTLNQRYVVQVYRELLGREAEAAGLAYWAALLDQGVPAPQVVRMVEDSPEYRGRLVNEFYVTLLGRPAELAGKNFFVGAMALGATPDQVEAVVLGSDEYLAGHGDTAAGFLDGVYRDVLGRPLDAGGAYVYGTLMLGQGVSRTQVAAFILAGLEAKQGWVRQCYGRFLGRDANPDELAFFAAVLRNGWRPEDVVAQVLGSMEYASRIAQAGNRF